ncbi:MAG: acetyl-CoA carboxylase biotin carboxylase subunit [bacterium]
MFKKVLIANRGEIALRIIRALKELGVKSVAVYSEIDKDSLHVKFADEAVCIGPAPSAESYLNIPNIISAAEITGAEAIHPGFGFLSEKAYFAEVCESCKIKFIGPSKDSIMKMGDKVEAKKIMKKAGVPVIPGSDDAISEKDDVLKIADKIGYPIMIKARAGGGGKGMRLVQSKSSLLESLMMAKKEAYSSFGDDAVYLEKFIEEPHHIEFQILRDSYGNVCYFPERDCSIQRRHQKLLEESPSPFLNEKLRKKMGQIAEKAAKAVNYQSVGTIEFLVDKFGAFYFMEMNTRIQVEHPVTEVVTEIDLIKDMIRISAGEKVKYDNSKFNINKYAIECRINAEDPEKDFIPSPGKIEKLILPGGPGVRIDSHIYQGYTISPNYDSMLAKIICFSGSRAETIKKMERALSEFVIEGIKTTIPFHKKIMKNEYFKNGKYTTNFITTGILEE